MIRYGVLGPVTAWRDGREVDLGSPQQRTLFALLLVHRNAMVRTDRMAEVLWPRGLPANAVAVLRTYVTRLRSGPLDPGVLLTRPGGYELRTVPGEVDVDRLAVLVATMRAESDRGDVAAAEGRLTEALGLVRGPVLPELPDYDPAVAERARLEELCATAREELTEARLAQGDHRDLVPALRASVALDPLRDRLWGQLMVALYRSGRQADALDAYRAAHRALVEVGLAPGPELRDLERRILLQDAALSSPVNRVRRVPRYQTSLVGREAGLEAVEGALRTRRLVSIVGPAGAGKTRLAAETARQFERQLGPRVWWVDLGSVGPGRAVAAAARALAVPQVPGRTPIDEICARLGEGPCLVVLDNCEHVAEEAAALAALALDEDDVRILVTSRESLRLRDEWVVELEGLDAPAAQQLFRERAAGPAHRADLVAEIVSRLDGLPLAIELAADKLRSISLDDLARGLGERLSLLGEGPRDAPMRQRSLAAAIAWSYDLCSTAEQRVLRMLAVFPGSFDGAAAESVAGDDVLHALVRLVQASLVAADLPRYRLLITVRTYARERLAEAGEMTLAQQRHRDTYLALAETVGRNMFDEGLGPWLARGRLEHDNFIAALHYSFDSGDTEKAFGLATWLGWFWFRSGFVRDGLALLDRSIAAADPLGPLWPQALLVRSVLAQATGSSDVEAAAQAAVDAAEEAENVDLLAFSLCWRGHALLVAGRREQARADLLRARTMAVTAESQEGMAFSDQLLGDLAMTEGDLETAGDLLVRARDRYRRSRVGVDAGYTLIDLARVRLAQQRFDDALTVAGEALADFRRREDPRGVATALQCVGQGYSGLGQPDRARAALDESRVMLERWGGALWDSGQPDELRQEPPLRPGVQPLAEVRPRADIEAADIGEK